MKKFASKTHAKLSIHDPWSNIVQDPHLIRDLQQRYTIDDTEKYWEKAVILFNEKPDKGIQFCIQHKLFPGKEKKVA